MLTREEQLEHKRRWYYANRERASASNRAWRKANPDKCNVNDERWRKANPDKARASRKRFLIVWRKANPEKTMEQRLKQFGLSVADYNQMLSEQSGVCAICGQVPSGKRTRLAVDHDHETGKVRGLLCHGCNTMLGFARDSKTTLQSAINYLAKTR